MKIENVKVMNFEGALRGMRNPKNSWAWADTVFDGETGFPYQGTPTEGEQPAPGLGPSDRKTALKLIRAGTDHRKFLRQIFISVDLTIPRYVWQELDTYKVATVRDSCSTMHKLGHADLTLDDFQDGEVFPETLERLNVAGRCYRAKEPFDSSFGGTLEGWVLSGYDIVRWMKKRTPEGYLQRATYTMSYETALSILRSRGSHRLSEWSGESGICAWIRSLPLMAEFEEALRECSEEVARLKAEVERLWALVPPHEHTWNRNGDCSCGATLRG